MGRPALLFDTRASTERAGSGTLRGGWAGAAVMALLLAVAAGAPLAAQDGRPGESGRRDDYGYQVLDSSDARCPFQMVTASGDAISLTASGTVPAADDGGAVVPLADGFRLYGETVTSLVMSSNGYLAVGASLAEENGGDFSNDRNLPSIPDNVPAASARLLVYHDDLDGDAGGGAVHAQRFSSCPRPSDVYGDEPCTVFEWAQWGIHGGSEIFDLEAVLYHSSFEIVYQVGAGDSSGGAGATFGIQSADARHGLLYASNMAGAAPGGTALCFFEPRFPPGGPLADLEVRLTAKTDPVVAGGPLVYTVKLANLGPSDAPGALLEDVFPPQLECSLTCLDRDGASCFAGPVTGDIHHLADLAAGQMMMYRAECTVAPDAVGVLSNSTTASPSPLVPDPDLANNVATDTILLLAGAELAASKTVVGDFAPGHLVIYTITLSNSGPGDQSDNPGDELLDVLPPELELESATVVAGGGNLALDTGADEVRWNGAVPALGEVVIEIVARIGAVPVGTSIGNQALVSYDSTGDGINDATVASDDPAAPGDEDSTSFQVGEQTAGIPTLSGFGQLLLVMLLAGAGLILLRRSLAG